jgi:uncharacterized protein
MLASSDRVGAPAEYAGTRVILKSSMLLNLNRIQTPHEHYEQTYGAGAFEEGGHPFRVVRPVRLSFDLDKDQTRFRLAGRVETELELLCSRCLEPFSMEVDAPFDLRYQPRSARPGEGERELEEDDLSTAFYDGESIDLGQLMREQFYLAVPMKPLCGSGCLGLCPVCGIDLNRGACSCARGWIDPRLAALGTLKRKD